jgi:hypothetical protein
MFWETEMGANGTLRLVSFLPWLATVNCENVSLHYEPGWVSWFRLKAVIMLGGIYV